MSTHTESCRTNEFADPDEPPIPSRFWWTKRVAAAGALLAGALVALRIVWGIEARRALDALEASYRAAGQPVSDGDFAPLDADDSVAIRAIFEAAECLADVNWMIEPEDPAYGPHDVRAALSVEWGPRDPDSIDVLVEFLGRHSGALWLVREARLRPGGPGMGGTAPAANDFDRVSANALSNLVSFILLVAHFQRAQGDDAEYFDVLMDAWFTVERLARVPHPRAMECSWTHLSQMDSALTGIVPTLEVVDRTRSAATPRRRLPSRSAVRELIARLLDEEDAILASSRACFRERWSQFDLARRLADGDVAVYRDVLCGGSNRPWSVDAFLLTVFGPMHTWDAIPTIERSTLAATAMSATNYQNAMIIRGSPPAIWTGIRGHVRTFSRQFTPDASNWLSTAFYSSLRRRFIGLALAIRLYQLDHGSRPTTLDDLVPDYLDAVPRDPFARGGRPIGYRPGPPGPFLHSVGPNGVEDIVLVTTMPTSGPITTGDDWVYRLDPPPPPPQRSGVPTSRRAQNDGADESDGKSGAAEEQQPTDGP